ncbi:MAG: hypothetical protein U0166_22235 [Acidobacteriota bacterium]
MSTSSTIAGRPSVRFIRSSASGPAMRLVPGRDRRNFSTSAAVHGGSASSRQNGSPRSFSNGNPGVSGLTDATITHGAFSRWRGR